MTVRRARPEDAAGLAALLNEIIAIGGTTAYQTPRTPETFRQTFIERPGHVGCLVAEGADGALLGFQHIDREGATGYIASFARARPKVPGVGRALMAETLKAAREAGIASIVAKIRADNAPGLGFYSAMGFADWTVDRAVPLTDGTPVDRISKRLVL